MVSLNCKNCVERLEEEVKILCEKRNAVILAHNYQSLQVQDVADFVGDSLELAVKALNTDVEVIVFAGVSFMAEVAAILNKDRIILQSVPKAVCPLADFLDVETVKKFKEKNPDAPLVLYINTSADAKMYADYIVTSASALKLISKLDADEILFGPDRIYAHMWQKELAKR